MSHVEQQLERHLPLATLFQNTTIGLLATILRKQADPLPWSSLVVIQPRGEKPLLFCEYTAGGTVLCCLELVRHQGEEQPCYGLQVFGLEVEQVPGNHQNMVKSTHVQILAEILTIYLND